VSVPEVHLQRGVRIAFDWGRSGAEALAGALGSDGEHGIAVVVDVLSFTTTLSVAVDAGVTVLPYPWRDGAEEYAERHRADLAVGRAQGGEDRISLSPGTMRRNGRAGLRIVLPSPNGATIARLLADRGVTVIGACLRNATAVAERIASDAPARVVVIAGGERWPDDTLRPAVEDLWGAGAVISALAARGFGPASPEAATAAAAYDALGAAHGDDTVGAALRDCASGRELIERGFGEDVTIAAEVDTSSAVPVLRGEEFTTVGP
jgi:2-phosphosulfolactate phosphatase